MRFNPGAMPPADRHDEPPSSLAAAVAQARGNEGFLAAVRDIYAVADAAVSARPWQCKACGACCDFAARGHRLYLSTGELALLAADRPPQLPAEGRCPYQVDNLCTVRAVRALGCRVFFCDPQAATTFEQDYEPYHRRLRLLHDAAGIPYHYVELTAALGELVGTEPS